MPLDITQSTRVSALCTEGATDSVAFTHRRTARKLNREGAKVGDEKVEDDKQGHALRISFVSSLFFVFAFFALRGSKGVHHGGYTVRDSGTRAVREGGGVWGGGGIRAD